MDTSGDTSAVHYSWSQANCPHWNATRQGLRKTEDIWLQVKVIAREEASRTPKTCLHLINNKQGSSIVTERSETMHIFFRGNVNASLPLHQFNDHCRCVLADRCFCRCKIVVTNMVDARNEGYKGFS